MARGAADWVGVVVGLLFALSLLQWAALSWRVGQASERVEEVVGKRLESVESQLEQIRELMGGTREVKIRQEGLGKAISPDRVRKPIVGQKTIRIAISTMRRGAGKEHVFETLDSLLPFLGSRGPLHVSVTVVDVERGDGSFAGEISTKYGALVKSGLMQVRHLDDEVRKVLYEGLVQTCDMARLYTDDLTRTIWRSKRVLDFVFTLRLAAMGSPDFVLVLEDDTPVLGSLHDGVVQCLEMFGNTTTACRWDFHWEKKIGLLKVFTEDRPQGRRPPKIMYPQGNLQGLFAMMLPTADWLAMCDFMRASFSLAPADWLIGRWLLWQNWRIAFMPPLMAVYHSPGKSFKDSSRLAVAKSLKEDPLFRSRAQAWEECDKTSSLGHPFKWEPFNSWRLRWVPPNTFFVELPLTDIEGHDFGIPRDAHLLDEDARLVVCAMTPECRAINANGWMKRSLEAGALSTEKGKKLLVRVPADAGQAELDAIRSFHTLCVQRMPRGRLPVQK